MNDAEAAATAAVGVVDPPLVHLTLGTGVGVAILARTLTTMFQPRGFSLSGGSLASHPSLAARVDARLPRLLPDWHGPTSPPVHGLPDPGHAAPRGLDLLVRRRRPGTIPFDRALPQLTD